MSMLEWILVVSILVNILQWLRFGWTKDDYKILLEMSDRTAKMWKESYEFERKLNYDIVSGKEYVIAHSCLSANTTFPGSFTGYLTANETAPIFPEQPGQKTDWQGCGHG